MLFMLFFMISMELLPKSYAELDLADFMAIYALTKVGIHETKHVFFKLKVYSYSTLF